MFLAFITLNNNYLQPWNVKKCYWENNMIDTPCKVYQCYQISSDMYTTSITMHTKICKKKLFILYIYIYIYNTFTKQMIQLCDPWIWHTWVITKFISTRYFGFIFTTLCCSIDWVVVISNIEFTTKFSKQINTWIVVRAFSCS